MALVSGVDDDVSKDDYTSAAVDVDSRTKPLLRDIEQSIRQSSYEDMLVVGIAVC